MIRASSAGEFGFEVFAAEVLIADQDEHLSGLALTASDELHADLLLVDLWAVNASALGVPSSAKMACSLNPQKNRE